MDGTRLDLGTERFILALAVLLACAVTSLVVVHAPAPALDQGLLLLKGLLIYLAVSHFVTTPKRLVVVVLVLAGSLAVATLVILRGLVAASGLQLLALVAEARFGGIKGDPNVQAAIANSLLPLLVALLGRWRGWARFGVVLLILLLIVTVVLSQSRAGMLLLGFLMAGLALRERRSRGYVLAGLAALAGVALLLPQSYWVRFVSIGQLGGIVVDRSLQLRQHALQGAWQLVREHPWLGVGLGNFGEHAPRFMFGRFLAHNSFLEVAATLGIFGGLAYLALLGAGWDMARSAAACWKRSDRRSEQALAEGIGFALLAFCLSALTLSIPFYFIVWVLFGLANASRRVAAAAPPPPGAAGGVTPR
jgi:O-antigen ligase